VATDPTAKKIRRRTVIFRNDPFVEHRVNVHRQNAVVARGIQITESEGHPFKKNSTFKGEDVGGEFYSVKHGYEDNRWDESIPTPQFSYYIPLEWGNYYYYSGGLYPVNPNRIAGQYNFDQYYPDEKLYLYSNSKLDAMGTTAIARCNPVSSPANLSVALGEIIKDGLPSLIGHTFWKDKTRRAQAVGSEYLNYQFGWLPLVSDIERTAKAVLDMDKLMDQYERDSGRLVRREYRYPTIRESSEEVMVDPNRSGLWLGSGDRPATGFTQFPGAKTVLRREIVRNIWFKGGFTYYLPSDYYSRSKLKQNLYLAQQILGLELTPENVWNLTPWSWAADWFANTGDVLENVSNAASDGLVLRYGYLMEHTIIKETYTATGYILNGYGSTPLSCTLTTEVKKRRRATPFGFGVDIGALSPRQLAIAAALGISRL
jgi:hypothetical protein